MRLLAGEQPVNKSASAMHKGPPAVGAAAGPCSSAPVPPLMQPHMDTWTPGRRCGTPSLRLLRPVQTVTNAPPFGSA
jgi:hypothetical protein